MRSLAGPASRPAETSGKKVGQKKMRMPVHTGAGPAFHIEVRLSFSLAGTTGLCFAFRVGRTGRKSGEEVRSEKDDELPAQCGETASGGLRLRSVQPQVSPEDRLLPSA